jgi:hypothetical protein
MANPTFGGFLAYLTKPFFRTWWAVITGFASILALYITRDSHFTIGGASIASLILVGSILLFLVLSVTSQGWKLFTAQSTGLHVVSFEKSREVPEGWLLIIGGNAEMTVGTVVDIHKRTPAGEVPLAFFEVSGRNSDGRYQATPIGRINPSHIREHSAGGLRPSDLVVRTSVEIKRMKEVARDIV